MLNHFNYNYLSIIIVYSCAIITKHRANIYGMKWGWWFEDHNSESCHKYV